MADVNKAAALCIQDKKLLVVKKKGMEELLSLGGKIEPGETEEECIIREVKEEAGCEATHIKHFETFEGMTHDGKRTLRLACYFCELEGMLTINPEDQIEGHCWINRDYSKQGIKLAGMLELNIVPALVKKGLL